MNMWKECKSLQEELVKTRRELHQIPEFGFDLPKTQAYVIRILAVSYTHLDVYKRQQIIYIIRNCVKGDDFLISLSRNYIFAMPSETVSIYAQCADIFPSSPFLPEYDALICSDPELFLHSLQAQD